MIGLELHFSILSKQLKSKDDALLLVIHCYLVNNGYRCVGTGIEESSNDKDSEQLPEGWNTSNGSYALRYKKKTGSQETKLLLKVLRVDNNALVNVLQTPGDLAATVDIPVDTFITNNFSDYNKAFVDQTSVNRLEEMLKKMINDLKPSQKLEESKQTSQKRNEQRRDPLMEPQQRYPPISNPRSGFPSGNPYLPSLGGADLDPLQRGIGGGMILDPQGFPAYHRPRPQPDRGGYGLPPGAVPPGARFDPVGPMGPRRPGPGPSFPGAGRFGNPDPDDIRRHDDYDDMFM